MKKIRPTMKGTSEFILLRPRPPIWRKAMAAMMMPMMPSTVRMLPKVRF